MQDGCHCIQSNANKGDDCGKTFPLPSSKLEKGNRSEEQADNDEVSCSKERVAGECHGQDPEVGGKK